MKKCYIKLKPILYRIQYGFLISTIVLFALFLYLSVLMKKTENIKQTVIIFTVIFLPLVMTFLLNIKNHKITWLMDQFIKDNDLLQKRREKRKDGQIIEHIDYHPEVYYKEDKKKNCFYIKIRLDGNPCSEKFKDKNIEEALSDMFQTPCIERIDELGYLIYCFELKKLKRIIIKKYTDIPETNKNEILLSKDIAWNWMEQPHILITGTTRSGKTQTCQYIMACLLKQGARIIYCDPKNDDTMRCFINNHPSITYATKENEIARVVRETVEEIQKREREVENEGIITNIYDPIFLFFDEMIAYKELTQSRNYFITMNRLGAIIVSGAGKNVYGGIILQRPDVEYIDGAIRDNLMCRIAMGHNTDVAYKMAFGTEFANVKNYNKSIGSGLIIRNGVDTRPRGFEAPYIYPKALDNV